MMRLAVGDKVRVHYHPANPKQSYIEGVVRRVAISTSRGLVFAIEVTAEVFSDRELPIRRKHPAYVLYESRDEFPGRIELLSTAVAEPALTSEPEPDREKVPDEPVDAELAMESAAKGDADMAPPSNSEPELEPQLSSEELQGAVELTAEHAESSADQELGPGSDTDTELRTDQPESQPTLQADPFKRETERYGTPKKTSLIAALFGRDK
jgi:hypothetical protein